MISLFASRTKRKEGDSHIGDAGLNDGLVGEYSCEGDVGLYEGDAGLYLGEKLGDDGEYLGLVGE